MAGKVARGFLGKIFPLLGTVLIIFCTVYIIMDIMDKAGTSQKIEVVGALAQENKANSDKALKTAETLKNQLTSQIANLQRQADKLERAIADMSHKVQDVGVKWHKNPKTGAMYCLTPFPLPWHHAQDWAKQQGGNLVMINDQQENDWLVKTFGGTTEYWIGLTDEASEGKWFWTIGSPAQYFNWYQGEPDNYKNQQHFGIINNITPGKWNDVTANEPRFGIVEKK